MAEVKITEVRKYSFWKAWVYCFFSKDFYQDVGGNWKGIGYGALLIIILLLSIPRSLSLQWEISNGMPDVIKKIPPFKIENGVFSAEVAQPYRFDFKDGALVIDTTGRYNTLTEVPGYNDLKFIFLVNKTKFMDHRVRFMRNEDKTHDIAHIHSLVFDRERIDRWGAAITQWSGPVYYFFLVVVWFLSISFTLLLYALLGIMFAYFKGNDMDYPVALRLAVASHFPAMIAFSIIPCFGIVLPWYLLWATLVSAGYLFFAVSSQKLPETAGI